MLHVRLRSPLLSLSTGWETLQSASSSQSCRLVNTLRSYYPDSSLTGQTVIFRISGTWDQISKASPCYPDKTAFCSDNGSPVIGNGVYVRLICRAPIRTCTTTLCPIRRAESPVQWLANQTHDKKAEVQVSSNTKWKWFQSHARINSCNQSLLCHQIKIEKIQAAK